MAAYWIRTCTRPRRPVYTLESPQRRGVLAIEGVDLGQSSGGLRFKPETPAAQSPLNTWHPREVGHSWTRGCSSGASSAPGAVPGDTFVLRTGVCSWHLVGRGQAAPRPTTPRTAPQRLSTLGTAGAPPRGPGPGPCWPTLSKP